MPLSEKEKRVRRRLRDDFPFYAEVNLKILPKAGGALIPFRLNAAQRYLHERIETQLKETGRVRALNLKGRQQGVSTYWEGRFYWKVTHRKGVRAYILTHEQDATDTIFEMVSRFHDNARSDLRPHTGASSAKELYFDLLDSGYRVGTAGNKATGRSKANQYFHGSEVAYWPNADLHKAGIMQTVPDLPGTEIALESTAFGVGGMFHDMWKAAENGEVEYLPIFIPWYWQDEYRRPVPKGFKRTKEETELAKIYGLDDQQLAWRRAKIATLKPSAGGSPEDLFKQEYPCNPDEAFLFSGRLVFSSGKLLEARAECFKPRWRGEMQGPTFVEHEQGRLRIWQKPRAGERYVIGADVAEGLEHGDFSSADVLRVSDGAQVAQWHGHIDPDLYGVVLYHLGKWYNEALIGVERNNHGLTTLTRLRNNNYRRLYVQEDIEHRSGKPTKKLGWVTTDKSKFKIIDQLAAELRDGEARIACEETVSEMSTFVIEQTAAGNITMGAKPGCFDDRVMSRAIAGEMRRQAPRQHPAPATTGSTKSADKWAAMVR